MEAKATRVRILNWDKYNAKRADVKKPTWHREENKSGQSPSLFGVPAAERYIFGCLKGLAGDEQSDVVEFEPAWFCVVRGGGSFTVDELDSAMRLLDGRVIEVLQHVPSTARARYVDVTLRDETGRDEETSLRSVSLPPPPPEKISNSDLLLTERTRPVLDLGPSVSDLPQNDSQTDLRLVGDPELNDWLVGEMRCTRRGFAAWLRSPTQGGGDAVRLEAMLRAAQSKWENDPKQRQKVDFNRTTHTGWLNSFLEIEARKYVASPAPPGGAAVIPLSEPKAGTVKREFCGECESGFVHVERGGYRFSEPCECVAEVACEGGVS